MCSDSSYGDAADSSWELVLWAMEHLRRQFPGELVVLRGYEVYDHGSDPNEVVARVRANSEAEGLCYLSDFAYVSMPPSLPLPVPRA